MSKRQEMREKRKRQSQLQRIVWIVLASLAGIFVAAFFIYPSIKPVGDIVTPVANPRFQADFNAMGDPNAPITITEYSDFQCPFCGRFYQNTEKQFTEAFVNTGKVRFIYRSLGVFLGPESGRSAEAAYCAGDQEKFWEMHDIIFENQNGENKGAFEDRRLVAFAEAVGLEMTAFNDCFESGKYSALVEQDKVDGLAADVKATPSFVLTYTNAKGEVITKLIEGAHPFDVFQREIEAALADMGQ